MDNQRAILIIEDYILDLKLPASRAKKGKRRPNRLGCKREAFDQASYSRWAANELLEYVRSNNDMSPIEAITEFVYKMDQYSLENVKTSYIFSVAHDIALDVLDIFLAME